MVNEPVTGHAATLYLGALAQSASPAHRGLNTRRLSRDALAAVKRSASALRRLRLGRAVTRTNYWQPVARQRAMPREHRGRNANATFSRRKDDRPRSKAGGG